MNKLIPALSVFLLLASGCYENRLGCLDPDATNFDERADENCPDGCCVYPVLSLDVARAWGDTTLASQEFLTDGEGNAFTLTRFRFYLSDLELITEAGAITAVREEEIGVINGTDTTLTSINANVVLVESSGSTTETVGTVQIGRAALTQVRGLYGTAEDFPDVFPPSAPAGSPLGLQQGLLNFNDGNGYLLGSLEYRLLADTTDRRIDLRGNLPLELTFAEPLPPLRGFDLTVTLTADYRALLGTVNLAADSAAVVEAVRGRLPFFVR